MTTFRKDPDATLDYAFDWTDWLDDGETISNYTVTAPTGLTKDSDSRDGPVVTVWLSGGTAGVSYTVTNHVVTSEGREDDRSFTLKCRQR